MTNTNCLAGMACPKCKSEGPFLISTTVLVTMHDEGSDEIEGGIEWGDDSYIECAGCHHSGIVEEFHGK